MIPSAGREMRLAFALEALAEQTLDAHRFEVVVVRDDRPGPRADAPSPLRVRSVDRPAGAGTAVARNVGWRATDASLVAFTDDDCRPTPRWLQALVTASGASEVFIQGRTEPDPDEREQLRGLARSQLIVGPSPWFETCNMAYPRSLLERLGGFDESFFFGGEDTDLALRAQEAGARRLYVDDALVWHAVHIRHLGQALSLAARWDFVPELIRRHPAQRRALYAGLFWKESHAKLLLALAGMVGFRSRPAMALAAASPYLLLRVTPRSRRPAALARLVLGLPMRLLVDATEIAVTVNRAVRHRVLVA